MTKINLFLHASAQGRLLHCWDSMSSLRSHKTKKLVLARWAGTEGLPALGNMDLLEPGDTGRRRWPPSPHIMAIPQLGSRGGMKPLSAPQVLLSSPEGLEL